MKKLTALLVSVFLLVPAVGAAESAGTKNSRMFNTGYDDAWQGMLQALTSELEMNIRSIDRESGLIQAELGGLAEDWGEANQLVEQWTTKKVKAFSLWSGFFLKANIMVEEAKPGKTRITVDTDIRGFAGWKERWVDLESNGKIEKQVFDAIAKKVNARIARRPAPADAVTADTTAGTAASGLIALTSEPDGADVEVDGNFVGQTPAELRLDPGKHRIRVHKKGHIAWERELLVLSGSSLNLKAALDKK